MFKICSKCNLEKSETDFYARPKNICKECQRARGKEYYLANIEKCRERNKKWYNNNLDHVCEYRIKTAERIKEYSKKYFSEYYINNRNRRLDNSTKWRTTHIFEFRVGLLIARARRKAIPGIISANQLRWRVEYYGWKCYYCGSELNETNLNFDHRIPVSRGGSNWPANIVPSCKHCNRKKFTMTEKEYKIWLAS